MTDPWSLKPIADQLNWIRRSPARHVYERRRGIFLVGLVFGVA